MGHATNIYVWNDPWITFIWLYIIRSKKKKKKKRITLIWVLKFKPWPNKVEGSGMCPN